MKRSGIAPVLLVLLLLLSLPIAGTGAPADRLEFAHPAGGHEVQVSAPAIAAGADGKPIVAWIAGGHGSNPLFGARPGDDGPPVRVNPAATSVDALHQAPGLAVGPRGEVYVTWSAAKPKPEGVLFASDLFLSRSLDGGRTFEPPLRVNDDRPISHSFEDLAVAPDATVLVGWIDSRDGVRQTATYLARVTDRGARLERVARLEGGETCVCCRVSVSAGPAGAAAVMWRKVFPADIRDMVVSRSADGGRTFDAAAAVHADRWTITACPHRGGQVAADARGRLYAVWYTEGTGGRPDVLFATAPDGRRFGAPRRVHTATGSVPDHARRRSTPPVAGSWSGRIRRRCVDGSCYAPSQRVDEASVLSVRCHRLSRRGHRTSPWCRAGSWSSGTRSTSRRRGRSFSASLERRAVDDHADRAAPRVVRLSPMRGDQGLHYAPCAEASFEWGN